MTNYDVNIQTTLDPQASLVKNINKTIAICTYGWPTFSSVLARVSLYLDQARYAFKAKPRTYAMVDQTIFDAKSPADTLEYTFDFQLDLGPTETIASATVTVGFAYGPTVPTDDNLTAMISGDASITQSLVTQAITSGFDQDVYTLSASITTSAGQTITKTGILPVAYSE